MGRLFARPLEVNFQVATHRVLALLVLEQELATPIVDTLNKLFTHVRLQGFAVGGPVRWLPLVANGQEAQVTWMTIGSTTPT